MKVGEIIVIGGEKFKVIYMYEDYILAHIADADPERMAETTLVFKKSEEKKLTLVKDKEEIKIIVRKLVEEVQGQNN